MVLGALRCSLKSNAIQMFLTKGLPFWVTIIPSSFISVSYTHLDVYKRQDSWLLFLRRTPPPPAPDYGYRDYLQGRLYKPLTAGKSYCVSFYLNLTEHTTYATNKMGAYLDDGSIDTVSICSKPITHVRPQMFTNDVIADTMNWVKIEGSFTATGTERFITLGNFFPIDSITYIDALLGWSHQWAYYLIDDVSVVATDAKANAGTDRWVEQTKSIQIGPVEDSTARGMDCKWYYKGKLIDSGNVISVNASTIKYAVDTYVVVQNVCGNITRDTMLLRTCLLYTSRCV